MEKTKVKLSIYGSDYTIVSDEKEDYVRNIGQKVDNKISEVLEKNKSISIATASMLVALDYCDELSKMEEKEKILKERIDRQAKDIKMCKEQIENAKIEINSLAAQTENLYKQIDIDKEEINALREKCKVDKEEFLDDVITESSLKNEVADF